MLGELDPLGTLCRHREGLLLQLFVLVENVLLFKRAMANQFVRTIPQSFKKYIVLIFASADAITLGLFSNSMYLDSLKHCN